MSDPEAIRLQARELGVELDLTQAARLLAYEQLLVTKAVPLGAVARADSERIRDRHILDSLRAAPFVAHEAIVCDLGSGAGLPGVVVAIALPDVRVLLGERRERRAALLELVIQQLGVRNAEVVAGPVEEMSRQVDGCLARAFAPLPQAWAVARVILRPGGRLVYFAGAGAGEPQIPPGADLEAVVRTPVLERAGSLVIMTRQ
ncbi:MAG: 16S rRNA (guanine(527)-N(7))-methyltransferase RsmG [Actinomycetota bacterium]